jgi:hypothetical protein
MYIHFDEIKITNSEGAEHKIEDLVFRIMIDCVSKTIIRIEARRMSATSEEIGSGYGHSHIDGCLYGFSGEVCMSNTDIAEAYGKLKLEHNPDIFQLFLYMIENFSSWESIEGGPYSHIRNITSNTRRDVDPLSNHVKLFSDFIMSEKTDKLECVADDRKSVYISLESIRELLEGEMFPLVPDVYHGQSSSSGFFLNRTTEQRDDREKDFLGLNGISVEGAFGTLMLEPRLIETKKEKGKEVSPKLIHSIGEAINLNFKKFIRKRLVYGSNFFKGQA